jgi:hypothetical protein
MGLKFFRNHTDNLAVTPSSKEFLLMKTDSRDLGSIRKKHNEDLIRRLRAGEPLQRFDSRASWFPPRPIIEKDDKAIAKLYSTGATKKDATTLASVPNDAQETAGTTLSLKRRSRRQDSHT